ncbi:UNVERIFIED_CONTAM: hypothetical protein Scaly_0945100 [Sesamum calycinum]|uniref:Uncharacterized protein n=1 Tax=Sesamum calycinum TaxID=2727403 RepID=A0AAW2QX64_9LAMI
MPKKKSALLRKLSGLLKISLFLAKLKKPTIPNLVFFKKTRKLRNFKLLKPYNYYSYVKEYEFSPSSTPLIQFQRKPQSGRISFRKLCSDVVLISRCLGGEGGKGFTVWKWGWRSPWIVLHHPDLVENWSVIGVKMMMMMSLWMRGLRGSFRGFMRR